MEFHLYVLLWFAFALVTFGLGDGLKLDFFLKSYGCVHLTFYTFKWFSHLVKLLWADTAQDPQCKNAFLPISMPAMLKYCNCDA